MPGRYALCLACVVSSRRPSTRQPDRSVTEWSVIPKVSYQESYHTTKREKSEFCRSRTKIMKTSNLCVYDLKRLSIAKNVKDEYGTQSAATYGVFPELSDSADLQPGRPHTNGNKQAYSLETFNSCHNFDRPPCIANLKQYFNSTNKAPRAHSQRKL